MLVSPTCRGLSHLNETQAFFLSIKDQNGNSKVHVKSDCWTKQLLRIFLWLLRFKEGCSPASSYFCIPKGITLVFAQPFQYMTFLFGLAVDQRELVKILVVVSPLFCQKRVQDFFLSTLMNRTSFWKRHLRHISV